MSNSDDLTKFRPRIGKRLNARERVASGSLRVATLVRLGHGRGGMKARARIAAAPDGFGPRHNARRVIVKAHLQRLTRYGAQAAARHLRYIEREGVEKDGSPGVLYGPERQVPRETFEQPRIDERHQFRFIVSPEDGADLDLTEYVRKLMSRVERDLGRPLEWAAVNPRVLASLFNGFCLLIRLSRRPREAIVVAAQRRSLWPRGNDGGAMEAE